MKCSIIGLGTALPSECISQADALRLSSEVICSTERQRRWMRVLFQRSGVQTRYTVVPLETGYLWAKLQQDSGSSPSTADRMQIYRRLAPPLAVRACQNAISNAAVAAAEITHLVSVSCTGFAAPGVDFELMQQLGLSPNVQRVNVGFMGCHGVINGLRAAQGLVAANPNATVLICAVELCSLHYRMEWDDQAIMGNALFADGAGAVVLRGKPAVAINHRLCETHSTWIDGSQSQMSWHIGERGFEMRLSGEIPSSIIQHLRPTIQRWLAKHQLEIEQIRDWVVHPGGPKILDAVEKSLGLDGEALMISRKVLRECGNMSSPTVLFILQHLGENLKPAPRVMLAFGPGLTIEAALLN